VSHEPFNSTAPDEAVVIAVEGAGAPSSAPHDHAGGVRSFVRDRLGIRSVRGPLPARVAMATSLLSLFTAIFMTRVNVEFQKAVRRLLAPRLI